MRVLPNNLVIDSTLSATNANVSYPIANIKHYFLKKIFKATDASTTITATFDTVQNIDCCYIGYTNATVATLKLYSASSVLLATKTINVSTNGGIFSTVQGVKYVTLDLASASNVYLGTFAVGDSYTMPDPDNNIIKGLLDNSTSYSSTDGQYALNKTQWLKKLELSFTIVGIDLYNEIYALFSQVDRPIWVDIYEELNNAINPYYAQVEFEEDSQSWHKYTFKLTCTEAR